MVKDRDIAHDVLVSPRRASSWPALAQAVGVVAALSVVWVGGVAARGSADTELRGLVSIGPVTPVCRAGEPCTKPATGVLLTFSHGARHVSTRTDRASGRYRLKLPAGVWAVRASVGMRIAPATVRVGRARVTVRNFAIDTGIR
jgi:hypothetical protein